MLQVKICSGTACYVQGGSFLFDIEEQLTEEELALLEIRGASCLGHCSMGGALTPPFATVGGKLIEKATVHALLSEIRKQLGDAT